MNDSLRADFEKSFELLAVEVQGLCERVKALEWDREKDSYDFMQVSQGFEHLCAGVLKVRNYCGQSDERYVDGLLGVFSKIVSDFVGEK